MELTSAMDKANMNLKGAGEQNMAFAGKIQMLEVDITKIRQVRKVVEGHLNPGLFNPKRQPRTF